MEAPGTYKIRCIAADDEPLALELISGYIRKTPFLEPAGAFNNGPDLWNRIISGADSVDLIFLDIQMPGLSGLDISRLIKNSGHSPSGNGPLRIPRIIFTTAFEQYAVAGYKVDAVDYLLKPVSYPEFLEAVSKVRHLISREREQAAAVSYTGAVSGRKLPEEFRPRSPESPSRDRAPQPDIALAESMYVKSEYRYIQIVFRNILYIEGLKDYIKIYLKGERNPVLTLMSMKSAQEKLPDGLFLRTHRSYIVNKNEIRVIEKGRLILSDGKSVPIGDSYRDDVLKLVSPPGSRLLTPGK